MRGGGEEINTTPSSKEALLGKRPICLPTQRATGQPDVRTRDSACLLSNHDSLSLQPSIFVRRPIRGQITGNPSCRPQQDQPLSLLQAISVSILIGRSSVDSRPQLMETSRRPSTDRPVGRVAYRPMANNCCPVKMT